MAEGLHAVARAVDRSWPWLPAGLTAAAVLVFLISYVAGPGATPAERVADRVEEYASAAARSDGETVCELSTARARRAYRGSIERLSCAEVVRNFGVGVPGPQLRDAPRTAAQVAGDTAVVAARSIGVAFVLVRRDGDWYVDRLQRLRAQR